MPYGLLTVNQALEILNLPSVEGGEKRLQTLNVVSADEAHKYQMAKAGAPAGAAGLEKEAGGSEGN